MRIARIKGEGTCYYHCMSRIIEGRYVMDHRGRERFRTIMRALEGYSEEKVCNVMAAGGRMAIADVLRCRVRYFSDGLVLGSRVFVENVFARHRDQFGPRRKSGARPMKHGQWGELYTMRDLRVDPVSVS